MDVIEKHAPKKQVWRMRHILIVCIFALLAGAAQAACYADYKAKMDNPLRLHYGVAEVSVCAPAAAANELRPRLEANGWILLNVVGVFDASGLAKRAESAGQYHLRY